MSTRIRIKWKRGELNATIEDTPTGRAVIEALPLESRACTWGEEVYFNVPVRAKRVACASRTTRACARRTTQRAHGAQPNVRTAHATHCNLLGRIEGDFRLLGTIRAGDMITLTRE